MNKVDVSNNEIENIFHAISDSVVVVDMEASITLVNQATTKLLGYENGDIVGKPLGLLFSNNEEDDNSWVNDLVKNVPFTNIQKNCLTKDGAKVDILLSGSLVNDSNGNVCSIVYVARDITSIKNSNDQTVKEIEEASRIKSDYLAKISHEIRNHMNAVAGMTNLLLEAADLDAEYVEYVEAVHNSDTWLLNLVNDILDFSKIESGKLRIEMMDFDLRPTIEGIKTLLNVNAEDKGISLACLLHSNLPTAVCGDPWRLRQILVNLTANAIKFTEKGQVLIQAGLVSKTETHSTIRFAVSDSGVGIDKTKVDQLFKPYSQIAGSSKNNEYGTGLGLAISKQLCELMGGKIGVDSKPGEGATFWFIIELQKQSEIKPMVPLSSAQIANLKVAIIAEKEVNCKVLSSYFNSWGCKYGCVNDSKALVEELRKVAGTEDEYQLVVIDVGIPNETCSQLAQTIKNDPLLEKLQLILMTSTANRGDAKKMEDAGFAAFLTKPIKKTQLFDCVAAVMGFHKTDRDERPELVTRHSLTELVERNRARILMVDDNLVNQMMTVVILEKAGFHVDIANNGSEAIKTLENQFYDIVLMDCHMPDMDGYEATIAIRKLDGYAKYVPIIAVTADVDSKELHEKCAIVGMDDYIVKPYQKSELINIINKWLDDDPQPVDEDNTIFDKTSDAVVFNKEAALDHVDGDAALLTRITKQFLDDYPKQLDKIASAIAERDNKSLIHAVHAIKATVGNLYATPAFNTASRLERLSHDDQFDLIQKGFEELEGEIDRLRLVFEEN